MKFEPKQKNKAPEVSSLALFICGAVAYAFSMVELIPGKGMLQLVALVLFCAMIYIFIRYKMTYYCYSVRVSGPTSKKSLHHEDDEETVKEGAVSYEEALSMPITAVPPEMLEFVCEKKNAKGPWVTECLLKLTDIEGCYVLPEEKEALSAVISKEKRVAKYKYFRNMAPADQMVVVSKTSLGRVFVYVEFDKKLYDYLKAVAGYNKNQ